MNMPSPVQKQIGPLRCVVVPGTPEGPVLVMCHGYGADASDLVSLAFQVDTPAGTTWIFPEGPLELQFGPGFVGRAWFPLVAEEIARLAALGKASSFSEVVPPGLSEARGMLAGLIRELERPAGLITLGGFSQGAMLAADLFLRSEEAFAGLLILSGTLICRADWEGAARARKGAEFFQSHGLSDPVLPYANAEALHALLSAAGLSGELLTFPGGHEIPFTVAQQLGRYLLR